MQKLSDIKNNFPEWYQDVIEAAQLSEHSPTPGCMVIRPYGYSIWENMQYVLDKKIKETGAQNAYFPVLIPKSFIEKEAKHVEGFSPELAVVTYAGGKKLEEPLVVRPTSETIIYYMFSKWIKSWRDLPLKINQWANIVRWEKRPRAFLRSREFLWQEGHTAHTTQEEARECAIEMLKIYQKFAEEYLAIPTVTGEKSESERFAGGDHTFAIEALMQDGKALQLGTSHVLSQKFSSAFDIQYQDKNGKMATPFCSSWGVTTRMIGALIMVHGNQNGLVMPPKIAPIAVVIIPIFRKDDEKENVLAKAKDMEKQLTAQGINVAIDLDDTKTPGAKFYHWEVRGVPLRIEIGPKDIEKNQAVLVDRLEKQKSFVAFDSIVAETKQLLEKIHQQMLNKAKSKMQEMWQDADTLDELATNLEKTPGFNQMGWCGNVECEDQLKKHKATIRCLLEDTKHAKCFACGSNSQKDVLIAKAY